MSLLGLQGLLKGRAPLQDVLIALLVDRVIEGTSRPHDRDVSMLLNAALDSPEGKYWSPEAIKMWRSRRRTLIAEMGRIREAAVHRAKAQQRATVLRALWKLANVI
jgi:hypothetical protein